VSVATQPAVRENTPGQGPLIEIDHLTKHFPVKQGVFSRGRDVVHAVEDVTLSVNKGETLGIVGESGCGKSTTARMMVRLIDPTSGTIRFDGVDITHFSRSAMRPLRQEMQIIFQDPYSSLNPRKSVGQIVGEPFAIHRTEADVRSRVRELLARVGLSPEHINRYPHEFSGGQRQRIGIARALALQPRLIVCDEPVSALDVSVQAQILNLLKDLQHEFDLTYVFISHDLSVIRQVSDRIAVMYVGRVVESGISELIYEHPRHPYTAALLSAVPRPETNGAGTAKRHRIVLSGDVPSPVDPPAACVFHPRCPRFQHGHCDVETPALREFEGDHVAACHYPVERWPMTEEELRQPIVGPAALDSSAALGSTAVSPAEPASTGLGATPGSTPPGSTPPGSTAQGSTAQGSAAQGGDGG
jgi:oligopeptide/dipeptide ABC transporter ATP-binding protein